MLPLISFERNVTSQNGEDGILCEVFRRLGEKNRHCVEFGAWDGKYLSNTWSLWAEHGWKALLIEGCPEKFKVLQDGTHGNANVSAVCRFVESQGGNSLEQIAREHGWPNDTDLLSIDIDGDDLLLFSSLQTFFPRVVVIEYNPTIPPEILFQQPHGFKIGSSARSVMAVAAKKGYRLAHITKTNLILVHSSEFDKLGISEPSLAACFQSDHLTYLIMGYDGAAFCSRVKLPFHPVGLRASLWRNLRIFARGVKALLTRRRVALSESYGLTPVDVTRKFDA